MRASVLLLLLALVGCGPSTPTSEACKALKHVPSNDTEHLSSCTDPTCGNGENPPTGGKHCGTTLSCKTHATEQPRCSWVHNLEHGHVVLLHNCPGGCPEIVTALEKLRGEAKNGPNGIVRALVAPDAAIPTKAAAVAWGWSWTGDAVDEEAIRCLLTKQDVEAPEKDLSCSP